MGIVRHYEKNKWEDWYSPKDFYGHASLIARDYCRAHKSAERETVYRAAQDAAFLYECSEQYRMKYKFVLFVEVAIRTALYTLERKEETMPKLTEEKIAAFEADVIAGELTYKQLSDKYDISSSNVALRIKSMKEEGKISEKHKQGHQAKVEDDTGTPDKTDASVAEPAPVGMPKGLTKEPPATQASVTAPVAAVMPDKLNLITAELMLQEVVGQLHPGVEITETFASTVNGCARTRFIIGGTEYSLWLQRVGG